MTARGRDWRVAACLDHADCSELHLRAEDGERRVLLWPFDRPTASGSASTAPRVITRFAWTRWAASTLPGTLDPRTPHAVFHGQMLSYQLAPAVAVAAGVSRVLLADEVGLGKTIQAGWILADVLARETGARALVAVPAGLRDQWAAELRRFFTLEAARVDAAWLRAAVADRPADVSPWAAPGVYLASIDFLKRTDVARSLTAVPWDVLIVDEAHAAAAPTDRHAALARVAAVSRRVVVITATPYSGDAAAFLSMAGLGGRPGDGEPLMFRRSRDEIGDRRRRRHRFAAVRIGRAEFRLQRLLERYTREVWREADDGAEGARLAMTVLRKRALSSPAAARRSLARRQELLRDGPPVLRQLSLFDEEPEPDEALPEMALATPGLSDHGREARWLAALVAAADRAADEDAKIRLLRRLLARIGRESIVVFTEYRDTLRRLVEVVPDALQLHGGLTPAERAAVLRRFNDDGGVLLATDAAAEGLNLQQRCRLLVNYELPWNPARLEQRIGRIDRIGQRRSVHAISLVARDTAEDLVVAALSRRLARVAATLGERDRLASLLTDTRTARFVIGGTPIDLADAGATPLLPPVRRASPADYPLDDIASELRAAHGVEAPRRVYVAGVRTRRIPPGIVVVLRTAAVTDGGAVAERSFAVHLAGAAGRPATRREGRRLAGHASAIVVGAAPLLPEIQSWFAAAAGVHRSAVAARLTRERWMRRACDEVADVQRGLFDRRALVDLDCGQPAAGDRIHEHERRLASLESGLDVRLDCRAVAVLIAWR